ncbi:MAG: hypothetical protein Q8L72_00755 [Moraxellaceae bacterium]|nr:hypothetical protein [Moraxellaceae bacterium]
MSLVLTNGKVLEFFTLTGTVVSASKNFESQLSAETSVVSGGGMISGSHGNIHGYIEPSRHNVSINSKTVEHQEIVIEDAHGVHHAVRIWDWGITCIPGHALTLLWAVPQGQQTGPYLYIKNNSTRQEKLSENAIKLLAQNKNKELIVPFLLSLAIVPGIVWYNLGSFLGMVSAVAYWASSFKFELMTKFFGHIDKDFQSINNEINNVLSRVS